MEKKITEKEFQRIVKKYINDENLITELKKNREEVEEDIYKACKFSLMRFGDIFPSGSHYYMYVLS